MRQIHINTIGDVERSIVDHRASKAQRKQMLSWLRQEKRRHRRKASEADETIAKLQRARDRAKTDENRCLCAIAELENMD